MVSGMKRKSTDNDAVEAAPDDEAPDDDEPMRRKGARPEAQARKDCPYLDTINRSVLDFDFEKFCSVSLSNLNVYGCLVCGKYFQGRGKSSHAYTHALEAGHHVFINLHTEKVYCLPDGYEVLDPSLEDIRHVLHPRFSEGQIARIDSQRKWSRALDGTNYLPGTVGLNNIRMTGYVNVVIQALMRVTKLRDYFLLDKDPALVTSKSPLVQRFGELARKIWNPTNYKGQVSPHEFLQAVVTESKKRFLIEAQSDPVEFISWFLNALHKELALPAATSQGGAGSGQGADAGSASGGGDKGARPGGPKLAAKGKKKLAGTEGSIIHDCFQGVLRVFTESKDKPADGGEPSWEEQEMNFLMLTLDLPPPPLFKDVMEKNIIPQVQLFTILNKFDGQSVHESIKTGKRRYVIQQLPKYLVLHMKRFTKNNFFVEKNPTIVNFPVKNLELKDYIPVPLGEDGAPLPSKYNLIANICHEGRPSEGTYRVHVHNKAEDLWWVWLPED
eukprot:jgi/Mesvir1/9380/Mv09831-RA.1